MKRKIQKIMFVYPNTRWFNKRPFPIFPLSFGLFTAILKDKYELEILDTNLEDLNEDQVRERISCSKPDIIALSNLSVEYAKASHRLSEIAKEAYPETITVLGGVYPTLLPESALADNHIDYIILAEGERRLPKLLQILEDNSHNFSNFDGIGYKINGQFHIQPVTQYINDLDNIPFPDYSMLDFKRYSMNAPKYMHNIYPRQFPFATVISSRGCPCHCIFCSTHALNGPGIRLRSAESVLAEIDMLVTNYGIREINFVDDNYLVPRGRIIKIMQGLLDRNYDLTWKGATSAIYMLDDEILEMLMASGCYQITVSIESGNQDVLKNIIKKPVNLLDVPKIIKKSKTLGFELIANFVIGFPGETWDQIRETFKFAEDLDVDLVLFSIATPFPKTELSRICEEKGYINKDFNFTDVNYFGFGRGMITTEEFTPMELHILRAFEWDRINFTTEEKKKKIAAMNGITLEELECNRISARRRLGIDVEFKGA